jgi:hypothetical protein
MSSAGVAQRSASLPAGEGYHEPHCPRFLSRGGDCLQNAMRRQEQFFGRDGVTSKGTGIDALPAT